MPDIGIREARRDDVGQILDFIHELAHYENAEAQVVATPADITNSLFSQRPTANALIAEKDGMAVGFAVYFFNYSTWLGKRGLYLEDLYVSPEHRGGGAGKALLKALARIAVEQGCGRFEWSVLDWNEPAMRFYETLGARPQKEWIGYRLSGRQLHKLADS